MDNDLLALLSGKVPPVRHTTPFVAVIALFNPLSNMVAAIRTLIISGTTSHYTLPLDA